MTKQDTISKLLQLRGEGEQLAAAFARAEALTVKSAKVTQLMDMLAARLMQNVREYVKLRATLPIQ